MKIKAKYKDKWHEVGEITKSDTGIEYQLDGVNGKVYSKDIKDLDLDKGEVTNPDGSITRFPGKEQLKKPLSKGINLLDKWNLIKAKLNHEDSFLDMDIFNTSKEDDQDGQDDEPTGNDEQAQQPSQEGGSQSTDGPIPAGEQPGSQSDEGPSDSDGDVPQAQPQSEESSGEPTGDAEQSEDIQPLEGDDLVAGLKELGYSDAEIAYIMHGHSPAIPSEEELKVQAHNQNLSQDNEGHKLTLSHRDEEHDTELEHKKKMQELELEYFKREKELKLKHLEEELAIKRDKMKSKDAGDSK